MAEDDRSFLQKNFHLVAGGAFGLFVLLMGALQFGLIGGDDGTVTRNPTGPTIGQAANTFAPAQQTAPQQAAPQQAQSRPVPQQQAADPFDGLGGARQQQQPQQGPAPSFQPGPSNTQMADIRDDIAAMRVAMRQTQNDVLVLQERLAQSESALRTLIARLDAAGIKTVEQTGPQFELNCFILVSADPSSAFITNRCANRTRQVYVGDSIPGLGRIEAIEQQGGQWTLLTQSGRLRPSGQ